MLQIGIVGKNLSDLYKTVLENHPAFNLSGIFDPSFQFEYPKGVQSHLIFTSFSNLIENCDALIFSSSEKIYYPLVELALMKSKSVFLHSAFSFSLDELYALQKLKDEAGEIVQIFHPTIYHDAFLEYKNQNASPLLVECHYGGLQNMNLLPFVRQQISSILTIINSNVKKVTANTISSFSAVPDLVKLRIDFANGGIADILVNSVDNKKSHVIKSYNYNNYFYLDFIKHKIIHSNKDGEHIKCFLPLKNSLHYLLSKQLNEFYYNVINQISPVNNIENQINTQLVIKHVKEKLRLCINV